MRSTSRPDEETPLLEGRPKAPLPWGQIGLVFLATLSEPISSGYIFPFINQLIGELGITGGDDRKIGYYAGLIESLFFATQAITSLHWSRLSDFIGRRPVILIGLLGLTVSNFAFGLSRTLGTLILSRCLAGVLNGNAGVMKSILGDIVSPVDMPRVFPMVPAVFCFGFTVAPLYGGALTKPQERWPHLFPGKFWATYPYFLPSLISGCFTLLACLACAVFMKESFPSKNAQKPQADGPLTENAPPANDGQPVSMWTLMKTYSVMITIANYVTLALVDIAFFSLLPLFCASPIAIGGLGFSPPIIGTFLAICGVVDAGMQALCCQKLIQWFGARRVFRFAALCFYPSILLFPIMSAVVTAQGKVGPAIWILMALQIVFIICGDLAFPIMFIFVTRSAPNKQSLGSVNGLSQSLSSVARAVGPALTTSLFAFSKDYNVLGSNFVYVVLVTLATLLVVLSRLVPDVKDEE